ncbi:hypothetical protein ACFFKC_05860 [Pseudoduganella danionis]|uniref:Uncharacterized protein n=1 Tax=Pseudoduganella danionis TaxID=1890295 RepID=A0ABW9SU18_9BURK|nr:hypothetical protein [Pseudoduganella danionis]MTW34272.1 hypothetical protein [Pseudoduganella danionis]
MQGTIQIGNEIITFMRGPDYDDAHEFGPSDTVSYSINTLGIGATQPLTMPRKDFLKVLMHFTEKAKSSFS